MLRGKFGLGWMLFGWLAIAGMLALILGTVWIIGQMAE